jgi:NADH-quinone oxidoreductase subunit C
MVVRSDVEEGFDGYMEYPAVDADFRAKCVAAVESASPKAVLDVKEFRGELTLSVRKEDIVKICLEMRDNPELQFNYLSDITAVDFLNINPKPRVESDVAQARFEVVYHLYSIPKKHRVRLRCPVDEKDCRIDSTVEVWAGAEWNERECYDFFGIVFDGNPDLRRILMPEDWQGWPLRKDFPLGGTKSFYYKKSTEPYVGEPENLIPRIRKEITDV